MTRPPYEAVEVSNSKSGDIVEAPSNGEAFSFHLTDQYGQYTGFVIEWRNNPDAWISAENNVSLSSNV